MPQFMCATIHSCAPHPSRRFVCALLQCCVTWRAQCDTLSHRMPRKHGCYSRPYLNDFSCPPSSLQVPQAAWLPHWTMLGSDSSLCALWQHADVCMLHHGTNVYHTKIKPLRCQPAPMGCLHPTSFPISIQHPRVHR